MKIPDVLLKQFEERCEALGMTPVEAVRDWLDNNPPPSKTPATPKAFCPNCDGTGWGDSAALSYCSTCGGDGYE